MENGNLAVETEERSLILTDNAIEFTQGAAKWAKFIAIVGFVFIGFMILAGLVSGVLFSYNESNFGMFPFPPFIFSFIYLIMGVIYFFPVFYLFKFSSLALKAINTLSADNLELSLRNIKSYFKFIGVLIIVVISIYILAIVAALVFGIFFKSML